MNARLLLPPLPARLLLALLGLSSATHAAEQIVYRATFSNDTGAPQAIAAYGWGTEVTGGALGRIDVREGLSNRVPDEVGTHTPFGVSRAEGFMSLEVPAVPRVVLLFTQEKTLQAELGSLRSLSWDWTAGNSIAHLARPAIKIAGEWYVANVEPFTSRNSRLLMADAVTSTFRFPAPEDAAWLPLGQPTTEDIGKTGAVAYAVRGRVEALGFWFRLGGSPGTLNLDNIQVTADLD